MATTAEAICVCPSCGLDLKKREPVTVGDLTVDPIGDVTWKGRVVHLTVTQIDIVHALARSVGRYVSPEAIYNLVGSHAEDERNVVAVQVSRLRSRFLKIDPDFAQIKLAPHRSQLGYRWCA
jgi:DNA-binding response OmpR family regulator